MSAIVDHLVLVHGCRRLAIRGPGHNSEADERFSALRGTLEAHGLELDPDLVIAGNFLGRRRAAAALALLGARQAFRCAGRCQRPHGAGRAGCAVRARGVNAPSVDLEDGALRESLLACVTRATEKLEDLWHAAHLLVSSAVTRSHVRERFRMENAQDIRYSAT